MANVQAVIRRAKRVKQRTPNHLSIGRAERVAKRSVKHKGPASFSAPRKKVRASRPDTFSGTLSRGEAQFAHTLAKETGLSARVIAAWTRLEGGNSTGDYNRLNIGHTDSGPLDLTADAVWSNPKTAAKATAAFLRGQAYGASPQIQAILPQARGRSDEDQIAVITNSGWATDPAYQSKVASVYNSIGRPDAPDKRGVRVRGKNRKPATIVKIGRLAERKFGLHVSDQPAFDPVDPVHAPGSFHYSGAAIDVNGGSPEKLAAFNRFVARKYGKDLEEMFYDPGINLDNGQATSPIGGHSSHVHIAETTGARNGFYGPIPVTGGVTGGYGSAASQGAPTASTGASMSPRERLVALRKRRAKIRAAAKAFAQTGNPSYAKPPSDIPTAPPPSTSPEIDLGL